MTRTPAICREPSNDEASIATVPSSYDGPERYSAHEPICATKLTDQRPCPLAQVEEIRAADLAGWSARQAPVSRTIAIRLLRGREAMPSATEGASVERRR